MATASNEALPPPAGTILALVTADGTAAASYAAVLARPTALLRDVADAVHVLCILHGAFPGIVDHALAGCRDEQARVWLERAAEAIAADRAMLARLASAVGPFPSTPGQAASETAVLAQRHALEMLARSDRNGCAAGAAIAFVLDWAAVRQILDSCARRLGIHTAPDLGTLVADTHRLLATLDAGAAAERAMVFGAQQMLAQHRGLWHLLEARASARNAV